MNFDGFSFMDGRDLFSSFMEKGFFQDAFSDDFFRNDFFGSDRFF